MGAPAEEAFAISLYGAKIASSMGRTNAAETAEELLCGITGCDNKSIVNACKLVTFDVWLRDPFAALLAKTAEDTNPDNNTIKNVRIMVERSAAFWDKYGPIVKDGFTFEPDGYTKTVDSGDGDFLTRDTLWDFKVTRTKPTSKHTLQLLMYWVMGQHSGQHEFKNITHLGIFNPRMNTIYRVPISKVEAKTIETIETEIICY